MHTLIATSLALPGTPLHGLSDFEPRARFAAPPMRVGRQSRWRAQLQGSYSPAAGFTAMRSAISSHFQ
jgi:hypothetical protein